MCCQILFANILFRIFHQYSYVRLVCSFILSSLSGLKIYIRLASQKEFRSLSFFPTHPRNGKHVEIIHSLKIQRNSPVAPSLLEHQLSKKVYFFFDIISMRQSLLLGSTSLFLISQKIKKIKKIKFIKNFKFICFKQINLSLSIFGVIF